MSKSIVFYVLVSLFVITGVTVFANVWNGDKAVVEAFENEQFVSRDSNIECIVHCGEDNYTDGQKEYMVTGIAYDLGIKEGYTYGAEENDNGEVMTLTRQGENSEVYIKLLTIQEDNKRNNYLVVNIILKNSIKSTLYYKEKLYEILEEYTDVPVITVNLVGSINGMLTHNEKDDLAARLMEGAGATLVVDGRKENLYTVYAYTNRITEYVTIGEDRVNINIAINYDENDDMTKVYLSTPLINEDY